MKREIVTLRGFDDSNLGGRVRKGTPLEVSQYVAQQLVDNGLAAYTSDTLIPPAPVGNASPAGMAAPSSASPAAPPSPSTDSTISTTSAPGDSEASTPKPARKPRAKKPPAPADE